jgi:GH15 family glucan-1,4-alpha-glucosidase
MEEYQPIENYGIIGDLTTTALVSRTGSIDFMCFPRFDSPTIFAALLDAKRGGHFRITPLTCEFKDHQRYFPDTNILLTRFQGTSGIADLSDFMAMQHLGHSHSLIRRVKVVRGEIEFEMVCAPRFDYGRGTHTIERKPRKFIFVPKKKSLPALLLRSSVPLKNVNGEAVARFKLRAGQTASFILEEADSEDSRSAHPDYISDTFKETMNYWLAWVGRSKYRGRWREMVNRSALVLKLLTSEPHGSIVAAPTFSLPEKIGSQRNWDYRFTWVRDASFTLYALMRLGYMDEARGFMAWIEERCRELKPGKSPLQVMYGIDGRHDLPEETLESFEGYKKTRPVRVGNAAAEQLQLDIYGELLDSVAIYDRHGEPISYDFWTNIVTIIEWVSKNWKKPDNGIWEVRGRAQPFLYSRAMCWLAIDRAMKIAHQRSYPANLVKWLRTRNEIYQSVYHDFWDPKFKSFVQYRGAKTLDASCLLLPMVKFISPTDPRWMSTLDAIKKDLVEDSLVYRYLPEKAAPDGLTGREGTFSACSFWYVECLARANDLRQARYIFEKALGYANHLGLYAEQLGPCGEHLGNFPQALTHIALISAAWNLDERLSEEKK